MEQVHVGPGLLEREMRQKARRLNGRISPGVRTQGTGYAQTPTKEIPQQRHSLKRKISPGTDVIHVCETVHECFLSGEPGLHYSPVLQYHTLDSARRLVASATKEFCFNMLC